MWVQSLGWEDPLEKEMATHFSILAWEIPWTREPGVHGVANESDQTEHTRMHTSAPLKSLLVSQGKQVIYQPH